MTNDELGRIVKTELGKIITVLNQILVKLGALAGAPRKEDETRVGPQKDPQDKRDSAPRQILVVPPSPTDTKQAKQPANTAPPRRKLRRRVWRQTKRIFLKKDRLERVGIMFGVAYAVTTILQWHDLRHNFEVDQRAWIKTEFILSAEIPRVSLPMKVVNVGKSPALWTVVDALFEVVDSRTGPSLEQVREHTKMYLPLLFPKDSIPFQVVHYAKGDANTLMGRVLTDAEIQNLEDGKAYIAVIGQVVYADQFGRHWTRFCAWKDYQRPDAHSIFEAGSCVSWNEVGDGAPPKQ